MKVVVLHNGPRDDASTDDLDVLTQRDTVMAALKALGHETSSLICTLDFDSLQRNLVEIQPDVVFNLVESLSGTDRLMSLPPLLLEALRMPCTGASSGAILASSNKLAAKQCLRKAGLPTPDWVESSRTSDPDFAWDRSLWIIKPVWEHASFGMDDASVFEANDVDDLQHELALRKQNLQRPLFAERFIEGREFNLSLLAGDVLPPAEIDFSLFPPDKPRIVGQQAKWDQDSFEYQQTPRRFDFPACENELVEQLQQLARACWQLFDLAGFARVDFRVDSNGQPWILEVNVNPCLSPDAGFAAALTQAGISFQQAVQQIVDDAVVSVTRPCAAV